MKVRSKLLTVMSVAGILLSSVYVSPAAASHLACGSVVTEDTELDGDVGPCLGDGIIVGADNIVLNLNGYRIFGTPGPGNGDQAGVRLTNRTGVSVIGRDRNSTVSGAVSAFDAGVVINGGLRNNVGSLIVEDNVGPASTEEPVLGDGIVMFHSSNNSIIDNVVSRNGEYDGIAILGLDSNNNLIRGNTVEGTDSGESASQGDGVGVIISAFLEADNPRRGESIYRNRVVNNVVRGNDNSGISNVSHVEGRIEDNNVADNGQLGESCFQSGPFLICSPRARPSNGIGVSKGRESTAFTRMFISDNIVTSNVGGGIVLGALPFADMVRQNRVIGNVALDNGGSQRELRPLGRGQRTDLHDFSTLPGTGFQRVPSCDENIWAENVFTTAFPPCAANGTEQPGATLAQGIAGATEGQSSQVTEEGDVQPEPLVRPAPS